MLTVSDLQKNVLPLATRVVAGMAGMSRRVGWVVRLNQTSNIDPDDLILANDPIDGDDLVAMAHAGAAGLIVDYMPSAVVTAQADLMEFPVLLTPENVRLRDVERAVTQAIFMAENQESELIERNHEALLRLLVDNKGVEEIVRALSRLTGKAAVLQDKRLRVLASTVPPDMVLGWQAIEERLLHFSALPDVLLDRHRLHEQPSSMMQDLNGYEVVRLIAPVISGGMGRGFVSLIGLEDDFTSSDAAIIEYGALMCALEMLKAKAVSEAEKRLRGDFLDQIIAGEWREDEIQDQIVRLRHDLLAPHVILVARWRGDVHPSIRRLETLANGTIKTHHVSALVRPYGEEIRIFLRMESDNPSREARKLAEIVILDGKKEYPNSAIAMGVGPMATSLRAWRASYLDAAAAADFARLTNAGHPLDAREIGVYRFLSAPGNREALRTLRDDILGDLLEYDQRQGGDLLLTLEGFFNTNGHLSQTADALHIHRNTLQYRLNRIGELTGLDMTQPDTRLAIQLAVKAKRLLDGELEA
ncbi:MAG TPA: helix-turn-helix domain-containing protein [Aggregatilineales bacterium]|nr:helix-turn-helix domain-containing protein [Aggregatilineales bacterium]